MPKYSKEELWGLYDGLPTELKHAVFSEEIANNLYNIYKESAIEDEGKMSQISENVGYVFLGLIPPEKFKKILEREVGLKKNTREKIYQKINDSIFFPLKKWLDSLYGIKIKIEEKPKISQPKKPTEKKSTKKDVYREPLR